jgi:6-phosphogluconate dehydrogenase
VQAFADDVSKALYASKAVAYAQGFDAIIAGAPDIATLLEAPYFADACREGETAWRRIVSTAPRQ